MSELGPPETHEKLSVKRLCGSSNEKQGEKLLLSCRHWAPLVQPLSGLAKNRHVGKTPYVSWNDVNHNAQAPPTDDWRVIDRAILLGLQRRWEKFGSARLCRKKKEANFVDSRKLLLRGYKLKKPNTTDLERNLQRPRLWRLTIDRRRWTWMPSAGRSSCFFFFFQRSFLTTSDLRFLLWKYLAKLLLERFRSAWQKSITFFAARFARELATGRARLPQKKKNSQSAEKSRSVGKPRTHN